MLKFKTLPILAGVGALFVTGLLATTPAQATTFNFTSDHCTGGCGTAPFGSVTLTQVGSNVTFDASLADSNQWVLTGSADMQYFKFNATGVVLADITVTQTDPTQVHFIADTGAFNGDGTGNFSFGIACDTGPNCATGGSNALTVGTHIDFTVANSTISDFLINSGAGNFFVADILSGTTGNTGPVDVAVPAPVIGHGLLVLLAIGGVLSGGRLLERRKNHHLQAA